MANGKAEGTSVDVTVNDQLVHFKSDDSQQPVTEHPDMDTQLKKMIVDKYSNLKGDIDEVKELNSEIMNKIILLEKKSEEKKKQRAINRMETVQFRETIPNGVVQTGRGIRNHIPGEINNNTDLKTSISVTPSSDKNDSAGINIDHASEPASIVAPENKSADVSDVKLQEADSESVCVVNPEHNDESFKAVVNVDAKVHVAKQSVSADSAAHDLSTESSSKDELSDTECSGPDKVTPEKDSDNKFIKREIVFDHEPFDDKHSETGRMDNTKDKKNTDGVDIVETKGCIGGSKEADTVQISPEKTESVSDDTESVDEKQLTEDLEKSKEMVKEEKANENFMEGFTDTFELTIPQMEYNLMLRRTKTNEKQDNRLAVKFDLRPNTGYIYSSLGTNTNQSESGPSRSSSDATVEHPENHVNRNKKTEMQQQRKVQEKATKSPRYQKPVGNERPAAKKSSVWKTTPVKKDQRHEAKHQSKFPDTETRSMVAVADSDKTFNVRTNSQTAQTPSAADKESKKTNMEEKVSGDKATKMTADGTEVEKQEQKHPGAVISPVDQPGALTPLGTHLMKLWAPAMEQMGFPVEVVGENMKVGEVEWKLDVQTGRIKAVNGEELREAITEVLRETQAELEQTDEDVDESEMEQFKFLMNMLNVMSAMCSDEGVDCFEAFRGCLGSMSNVNLVEIYGEEIAGQMQTMLTTGSQMMRAIEPLLTAAGQPALGAGALAALPATGQAALPPSGQPAAVVPKATVPNKQPKQSEVEAKQVPETKDVKITQGAEPASNAGRKSSSKDEAVHEGNDTTDVKDKTTTKVKVTQSLPTTRTRTEIKGHDSEEEKKEEDVVLIDEQSWIDAANVEMEKGLRCRDIREKGMDTIICLDLSSSMRGEAWNQAIAFIRGFIECIQSTTLRDNIFEHVALVTFGSETTVQQHMTCDYFEVLRKLDHLKPGGPSPMLGGMFMSLAAIRGAGSVFGVCGYKIYPRMFLITDGRATPGGMIVGPDHCSPEEMDIVHSPLQSLVSTIYNEHHWTINPVPVGSFDLTLLERLARDTKGKITSPEDWKRVSRTMKNLVLAAKVGSQEGIFGSRALLPLLLPAIAEHELSAEDHVEIAHFLETHKSNESSDDEAPEDKDLPPLGTRVRRRQKLTDVDDSCNLGTVTKRFTDGHIGVTWDKSSSSDRQHQKVLFSSSSSTNEVTVTEEPRILRDELIAAGCTVRRGKDWHYGDQDGGTGSLGTVFDVDSGGILKIRWRNGNVNQYKFGCDGDFDVEVVSPTESSQGHVPDDLTIEGAVGGAHRSLSSFLSDSDEDQDTDSSLSSDDSDMTLEEKMNRKNAKKSKSLYIIEPSRSAENISDNEQSIVNSLTDDDSDTKVAIHDKNHDKLQNSEVPANVNSENVPSQSESEKIYSKDDNPADKPKKVHSEDVAIGERSPRPQQMQNFEKSGAKPKQPFLLSGSLKISSADEKISSALLVTKNEAQKQLPEVKKIKLSLTDNVLQKGAKVDTVSSQLPEKCHTNQENGNRTLPKLPSNSTAAKQHMKFVKPGLQLPSNTVIQQNAPGDKPFKLLPSTKVRVDEVISQTSAAAAWCWNDSGVWRPYPAKVIEKIEKSFQTKKHSVLIQINDKPYRVVFARMEQIDIKTKTAIKVQRQ